MRTFRIVFLVYANGIDSQEARAFCGGEALQSFGEILGDMKGIPVE